MKSQKEDLAKLQARIDEKDKVIKAAEIQLFAKEQRKKEFAEGIKNTKNTGIAANYAGALATTIKEMQEIQALLDIEKMSKALIEKELCHKVGQTSTSWGSWFTSWFTR